jgi:selenide,water dikinase
MQDLALTSFSRFGGCSCKLDTINLDKLRSLPEVRAAMDQSQEADDAAIIPLGDGRAILSSIDFQNVIVDDAILAGEIAARNALSDIFACGVQPTFANIVLVVPYGERALPIGSDLMRGLARACQEDHCPIVGGHTIQGEVPIVGLSVHAIAPLKNVKRKSGAQDGDILLLTKPLGTGIAVAAYQLGGFSDEDFLAASNVLRRSNRVGARLGAIAGVTAMTDITGFGLLGHMSEVAENSNVTLSVKYGKTPVLRGVESAAREGMVAALGEANLKSYGHKTKFENAVRRHERLIMSDPQTNGGLLICVRPDALETVISEVKGDGLEPSRVGCVKARRDKECLVEVMR